MLIYKFVCDKCRTSTEESRQTTPKDWTFFNYNKRHSTFSRGVSCYFCQKCSIDLNLAELKDVDEYSPNAAEQLANLIVEIAQSAIPVL